MSLSDLEYAFFLPLVLALYWLVPRRAAWQNAVLLVASAVFYASWDVRLLPILLVAAGWDFAVGLWFGAHPAPADDDGTPAAVRARRLRRAGLWASVILDLALLGTFKYLGFFAQSLNDLLGLLGLPDALPVLRLALPLGISYWTLQKLGYILDAYYGRVEPCRDPLAFLVFSSFFPQLIAGPISRAGVLLPQVLAPRRPAASDLAQGAATFLLGFTLKAYVADWLARWVVDPVFADPSRWDRLSLWVGVFAYAAQVFSDFAGYSFMAMASARLLGIRLPLNFDRPFLSRNLPEFWRRWHITLNAWLFDYLFAPLTTGRSRFRGKAGPAFVLVFLGSGLWHGATWGFVLWGLLQGLGMAVHERYDRFYKGLCRKDRAWVARRKGRGYALASLLLTQVFFVLTLVPFRAASLADAGTFAAGLFGGPVGAEGVALGQVNLVLCAGILLAYHLLAVGPGPRVAALFRGLPAPVRGVAYGLVVAFLFVFVPVGASTFIYAQF